MACLLWPSYFASCTILTCFTAVCPCLQDRIAGGAGTPSPAVVVVVIACLFMVNSVLYVCVMHAVYIPLLQGMGYKTSKLPQFVQRIIARRSGQIATQ